MGNSITNQLNNSLWNGQTSSQVIYSPYTLNFPQYFLTVRQIENGWIVIKDGKEYVMTEPKDILEFFDGTIK